MTHWRIPSKRARWKQKRYAEEDDVRARLISLSRQFTNLICTRAPDTSSLRLKPLSAHATVPSVWAPVLTYLPTACFSCSLALTGYAPYAVGYRSYSTLLEAVTLARSQTREIFRFLTILLNQATGIHSATLTNVLRAGTPESCP